MLEQLFSEKKSNPAMDRKRFALWPVITVLIALSDQAFCDADTPKDAQPGFSKRVLRFWLKIQTSLRSTNRVQRDAAVLCCLSLCLCAGYTSFRSFLRDATVPVMSMLLVSCDLSGAWL